MSTSIGDRLQGDRAQLTGEVSPIAEGLSLSLSIRDYLLTLQDIAGGFLQEIAELEHEGVYESEPTPSWEQRSGKGCYLRLVYPTDGQARRKEYVGANPEKVAAALAKIKRTHDHQSLRQRLQGLTAHVAQVNRELREARSDLDRAKRLWGQEHRPGDIVVTPIEKVR